MARHGRHITLDDLPPAYREQAERQLRAAAAGCEPRHEPARPTAPICSNKAFAPTCPEWGHADFASDLPPLLRHRDDAAPAAPKKVRAAMRRREPNKTEARFNREILGGAGLYEALTFHVEGGAYTPDWLLIDPETGAPTCFEVKGAFEYPSENRTRFAFLTCRARFPFVRFRWFRLAKHGTWREEHPEGGRA